VNYGNQSLTQLFKAIELHQKPLMVTYLPFNQILFFKIVHYQCFLTTIRPTNLETSTKQLHPRSIFGHERN